ncbi:hypothetical protein SLS57_010601 [Botryosphaeria dothidea]
MLLRPATEHDIPEMATIGAAAYVNDPIDVYLYPNRHVHPADYRKAYAQNIKRMLTRPGETHAIVVVLEPSDEGYDGRPTLIGYTAWRRFRASETQRQPEKKTFAQRLKRVTINPLVCLYNILSNRATSRRATLRNNLVTRWFPCFRQDYSTYKDPAYVRPTEFYKVNDIVVHPDCQRRGAGTRMMRWGMDLAAAEGVPVCLSASLAGLHMYQKLGFKAIGMWRCTLGRGMKRVLMQWDPPGMGERNEGERGANGDQSRSD